jgi:hypothetical protein
MNIVSVYSLLLLFDYVYLAVGKKGVIGMKIGRGRCNGTFGELVQGVLCERHYFNNAAYTNTKEWSSFYSS